MEEQTAREGATERDRERERGYRCTGKGWEKKREGTDRNRENETSSSQSED